MKKIFIFFVILVLIVIGVVVTVKSMTLGLTTTAETFFTAVAKGDQETAWAEMSEAFRQDHSRTELSDFLAKSGLNRYESAVWAATNYLSSSGELTGRVFTETGAVVPVHLDFVREEEGWRIHGLDASLPTLTLSAHESEIPDLASLESMVKQALHDLGLSLRTEDFSRFHNEVSALWKASSTPDQMRASFAPFQGRGQELMDFAGEKPVFNNAPEIDEEGELRLVGTVPRPEGVLHFDMDFMFEYPGWKLRGLRLSL